MTTSISIEVPFQYILGLDGQPLTAGYVYFGQSGLNPETSPVAVYWDEDLTIPAAQPVRTQGGYLVRNGTPARVYTAGTDCSMLVRDKNSRLVWSALNTTGISADSSAAQELAGGVNLNTIQTPGFYVQSQDAEAASGTNYPIASAGALVVLKNASGVSQLYYTYGSASVAPRAFFRALYNGSWSTWRESYHSGNLGAASETASGLVELATAAEVQAGTDTDRAVTPAGLASRTATESSAGIVRLATAAEAQAGTDGTKALSPLRLRNALNAIGSAPIYACRAWVNFNGTGTVAIRASGNVSSITDNGVGDYTINFTTALPDANYSVASLAGNTDASPSNAPIGIAVPVNASSCRLGSWQSQNVGNRTDFAVCQLAVFR